MGGAHYVDSFYSALIRRPSLQTALVRRTAFLFLKSGGYIKQVCEVRYVLESTRLGARRVIRVVVSKT